MNSFLEFGVFALLVVAVTSQEVGIPEHCGECRPEECPEVTNCAAGVIIDSCRCCRVCAKIEYEMCAHASVPGSEMRGTCGENLECRLRTDLRDQDTLEALCYCRQNEAVCGDDGDAQMTYNNECHLRSVAKSRGIEIDIVGKGPCDSRPEILSAPMSSHNSSGDDVVLSCEARGHPTPKITWTWTRVDGKKVELPYDDDHVSVNMRGGPERFTVTSWLQIMDVQKHHEGDYACVASSPQGESEANARVKVTESRAERKQRRQQERDNDL